MTAPTVSPLPTPPSRQDPETFADRSDAFIGALPLFQTEINTLGVYVEDKATEVTVSASEAASDAAIASAAATTAVNAANAEAWVSGTSYAAGDVVYSTLNYQTYRCAQATSGTTDPSADAVNWVSLGSEGRYLIKTTTYSASAKQKLGLDVTSGPFTVTMPANPVAGDYVLFVITGGDAATNNVTVDGNTNTINGDATLTVDLVVSSFSLVYNGVEWRVV
jgi:hypothetical protein